MRAEIERLVEGMDPAKDRGVFSTTGHQQAGDRYFLESGDKVRYFFEEDAFDQVSWGQFYNKGNLVFQNTVDIVAHFSN